MANSAALVKSSCPYDLQSLADQLFVPQTLHSFNAILSLTTTGHAAQTEISLVAGLISRLCREENHKQELATSGILDTLATRLASVAVRQEMIVPGARLFALKDGISEAFPDPAPPNMKLAPILGAISAIIGDSKYRAYRFSHAPSIMAVFPSVRYEHPNDAADPLHGHKHPFTAMEYVLPVVPTAASSRNKSSASTTASDRSDDRVPRVSSAIDTRQASGEVASNDIDDEIENPIIPWLTYLARTQNRDERLMAISVLSSLYRAGLGLKGYRERSIGFLVVPLVVEMMIKVEEDGPADSLPSASQRMILEEAPLTLAHLITDSESLQKAAFECDAVMVLTKLLRRSYTPVPPSGGQPWTATPGNAMEAEERPSTAQLGEKGEDALLVHRIRTREAVLKAVGALAAGNEDYRKAFVTAEDFIPLVVESLSEFPEKPQVVKDRSKEKQSSDPRPTVHTPAYGRNTASVIVAACHVIRVLTRSVAILRTAIVDHDVAAPIFETMKHSDINMQIAATSTMVNLVMEVSPVREVRLPKVQYYSNTDSYA